MMKSVPLSLLLMCHVAAFIPTSFHLRHAVTPPKAVAPEKHDIFEAPTQVSIERSADEPRPILPSVAGIVTAFVSAVGPALAATNSDDLEIAELPPVYVPILFAIFIIGGVGLLTGSLGDVMNDGKFGITNGDANAIFDCTSFC